MSISTFPPAASPLGSGLSPAPTSPLRLAIVEDDLTIRELLHRYRYVCPEFDCVIIADSRVGPVKTDNF